MSDTQKFVLRIPAKLKETLEKNSNQSLNSEIVSILSKKIGFYNDFNKFDRVVTYGSAYGNLETIKEYIQDKVDIIRVTLAVRNGRTNKSALTVIFHMDKGNSVIFDSTNLTAERTARELEVYAFCDLLDALAVFSTTRYITKRVEETESLEAEDAIRKLENLPSESISHFNIYKFLSLFKYVDENNQNSHPSNSYLEEWKVLCSL